MKARISKRARRANASTTFTGIVKITPHVWFKFFQSEYHQTIANFCGARNIFYFMLKKAFKDVWSKGHLKNKHKIMFLHAITNEGRE